MVYAIGIQQPVGQGQVGAAGIGCPTGGCRTASAAYSGVYNSHASPYQGQRVGYNPYGMPIQPGLNRPGPPPPAPIMGTAPIGNYMITQSVPTPNRINALVALGNNTYEYGGNVFSPANQFVSNGKGLLLAVGSSPYQICDIWTVGRRNMFQNCVNIS